MTYPKEQRAILSGMTRQGVRSRRNRAGGTVYYLPGGKVFTLHTTISDHRGLLNARSVIRQAGLLWPLDHDYPSDLK